MEIRSKQQGTANYWPDLEAKNFFRALDNIASNRALGKCRKDVSLKHKPRVMYRSIRSFNIPPPGIPRALDTFNLPSRGGGNLIIRVFQRVGNLIPMHRRWGIWTVSSISCDMSLCFEQGWQTRFGTIAKRKIVVLRPVGREAKVYTSFVLCLKVFKFFFMIHAYMNIWIYFKLCYNKM